MTDRTAEGQLARILRILPAAAREEGVALDELADAVGVDARTLVRDLQEVYTRAFYHPAGGGEDVQVLIESDRVRLWTTAEFRRPVRLDVKETLALDLGLRMLAADAPAPARAEMLALARKLEAQLSTAGADPLDARYAVAATSGDPEIRRALVEAARERRRCEIAYLKRGAAEPDRREIEPYAILLARGHAYVVARCRRADGIRLFRSDRVVGVRPRRETFVVPDDFDPLEYASDGQAFRADGAPEVAVRYSPRIARWIREHGPVEEGDDGSVVVRYQLADPEWAVAHVLRHGRDAEVLEPAEVRERVVEALAGVVGPE